MKLFLHLYIPPIPLIDRPDQLVWHFNFNGEYSVKSGYHILAHNSVLSLLKEKPEKSLLFNQTRDYGKLCGVCMKVVNKVKSFWWRASNNIPATKENLLKRRCNSSNLCPICEKEVETVEHTLFFYSWVRPVWFGCNIQVLGDLGGRNASTVKWASEMVDSLTKERGGRFYEKGSFDSLEHLESEEQFCVQTFKG